ncbi:unnamed protein product [Ilex paraguariensis]|uniref:Root cap n=1 Tax=Ilex paraguariensis TaxID=185542 RepID=A0ABC8RI58_9AQUA
MDTKKSCIFVAYLLIFFSIGATFVQGPGNGGNNGNRNGNNNNNNNRKKLPNDAASTHYRTLKPLPGTEEEQALCGARGACYNTILTCPAQCPQRKPKNNRKRKGCFVDCSSRFVGGDGVMFYFHGAKTGDFTIVSDDNLHINAHFIGTRPEGRTRDFTWVQALSVMFDTHTLALAAKKISHWDDNFDALVVKWDGETVIVPMDGEAEWRITLVELDVKVTPIGEEDNRIHSYRLPADDAFAHLETQFRFFNLSDLVEGVLGKTYRPGYFSPVKRGVPMPMMGGEDKYQTPSLYSPLCKACRFHRPSGVATMELSQY